MMFRPVVVFHLNYLFQRVWPIAFFAVNTAEGNKIHLFHLQKVFCLNSFDLLIGKVNCK